MHVARASIAFVIGIREDKKGKRGRRDQRFKPFDGRCVQVMGYSAAYPSSAELRTQPAMWKIAAMTRANRQRG